MEFCIGKHDFTSETISEDSLLQLLDGKGLSSELKSLIISCVIKQLPLEEIKNLIPKNCIQTINNTS